MWIPVLYYTSYGSRVEKGYYVVLCEYAHDSCAVTHHQHSTSCNTVRYVRYRTVRRARNLLAILELYRTVPYRTIIRTIVSRCITVPVRYLLHMFIEFSANDLWYVCTAVMILLARDRHLMRCAQLFLWNDKRRAGKGTRTVVETTKKRIQTPSSDSSATPWANIRHPTKGKGATHPVTCDNTLDCQTCDSC